MVGDQITLRFPGMTVIAGQVVRVGRHIGVCFAPARLQLEERRDLLTKLSQAA